MAGTEVINLFCRWLYAAHGRNRQRRAACGHALAPERLESRYEQRTGGLTKQCCQIKVADLDTHLRPSRLRDAADVTLGLLRACEDRAACLVLGSISTR
ncbi:hypothetical protein D3C72_1131070 [compost metagenome]